MTVKLIVGLGPEECCIVLLALLVLCDCPKKNVSELDCWPQEEADRCVGQSCSGGVTSEEPRPACR